MSSDVLDSESEVTAIAELDPGTALGAINRAEIDMQISTAKKYPRSITRFKRDVESLACLDEETASTMFYSVPRSGKQIIGPSVRFAEVVASSWGNIRSGARVIAIDDKFVTAQGMCFDLEKNICVQVEVKRRITDKNGRTYGDDMITVTGNAACSIALRNAVFKVVPFGLAKSIYEKCMDVVKGDAKTLTFRRDSAMAWFLKVGATQEQVLQAINRASMDDVTVDDLVTLQGLRNAIKDGESSIEEALGPVPDKRKLNKAAPLDLGKKQLTPAEQFASCTTKEQVIDLHLSLTNAAQTNEEATGYDAMRDAAYEKLAPKQADKQKRLT